MRRVLKWAAIVLGGIILVLLIASPFLLRFGLGRILMMSSSHFGSRIGGFPGPYRFGGPGWMMMGGGLFSLLSAASCLVFLALVVAGVVFLVRALSKPQPAAPFAAPPAPLTPVQPGPEQATPDAAKVCASCGKPLQPEWTHCPHCGAPI